MESRLERNRKIKNHKRQRRLRIAVFVICILFFLISLYKVDSTLREMMLISDQSICRLITENGFYKLQLMGEEYLIDKEQIDYYLGKITSQAKRVLQIIYYYKDKLLNN